MRWSAHSAPARSSTPRFAYVYLDATYLHVRNSSSQVTSMAVVVATGITATGAREVLGLDVGDSEDEVFWRGFLAAPKRRGLSGVRLVISDQHAGLVAALRRCFQGAGHQRCRVHFAQSFCARAQVALRHGRGGVSHDLRPAGFRHRRLDVGRGPRSVGRPVPQDRSVDGPGQGGGAGVQHLSAGALVEDLVDQSVGAGEQGARAQSPRRGNIPQRGSRDPTRRCGPGRHARRVAVRRAPLPLRRLDGVAGPQRRY
ncbi:transposase, mutator type [Rhodococcus ruber BKS 20-38]|uniref:Mutator family transposase n=1 Tax=Rhodococcus ruber BKS 20-38 TaxID=1278076 RepID=M2XWX5_9NOCA|nr:transposase, mutator type [Rhodococcus ruber BKS 20-38]